MNAQETDSARLSFAAKHLITPKGMLVTTSLLAIYTMYAAWMTYVWGSPFYGIVAALAGAACCGAALVKTWSQLPLHLLTAIFAFGWLRSIYEGVRSGYFDFAFDSGASMAAALAPGTALLVVAAGCSVQAHRQFRRTAPVTV